VAEAGWLLDTSILIDVLRGYKPARDWVNSIPEAVQFVSVVTAAELFSGCHNRAEQRAVERELALYQVVWLDEDTSQTALQFYQRFHLSHGVGFLDCLIAATAIALGLRLTTLNLKHFAPFSDLQVERPY
jgi:predicted nucleic acid-binding protein